MGTSSTVINISQSDSTEMSVGSLAAWPTVRTYMAGGRVETPRCLISLVKYVR